MLVLPEDEREKLKLGFDDSVPCDCSDKRDIDRCLLMISLDLEGFAVWEGDLFGISGLLTGVTGLPGAVKYWERWFGSGDIGRFGAIGTSGLVGGEDPAVWAPSERSSSHLLD